jgi:dihydrolipoamide dehydrogenase
MTGVQRVDVAIVGAGTAGLAALREVRKHTEDFLLVHDGPLGTTCARIGCMPSKALVAAANAFHTGTKLETFGIRGGDKLTADIPAVLRRVRALRDQFVAGVLDATQELGSRSLREGLASSGCAWRAPSCTILDCRSGRSRGRSGSRTATSRPCSPAGWA